MGTIILKAPVSGIPVPLKSVPDAVFSSEMLGGGVAIDPLGETLVAPCDGRVVHIHPAHHALTLRAENGAEVLLHVGIDTVKLSGAGFSMHVAAGDSVVTGQTLLAFDADAVGKTAKSLLTVIAVTTEGARVALLPFAMHVSAGVDDLLEIRLDAKKEAKKAPPVDDKSVLRASSPIIVSLKDGIHARPAALLAEGCRKFSAQIELHLNGKSANARSPVAIMGLDIRQGDRVTISATGADADRAIQFLTELFSSDLRGHKERADSTGSLAIRGLFKGVAASPGIGIGVIHNALRAEIPHDEIARDSAVEKALLDQALAQGRRELDTLREQLRHTAAAKESEIFTAHMALLDDPDLIARTRTGISSGLSACASWRRAIAHNVQLLEGVSNVRIAGRAVDVRDVGDRILRILTGSDTRAITIPPNAILITDQLTPSEIAGLDRSRISGICMSSGGPFTHVAILARSMEIPLVTGIDSAAFNALNGSRAVLDGVRGELHVDPSDEYLIHVTGVRESISLNRQEDLAEAHRPAVTTDGVSIAVTANIGGAAGAREATEKGAAGVGVLRSEYLFLHRESAADEAEQISAYRDILDALGPEQTLTIRTLDAGADKPLPWLKMPAEENPFLGVRGIRLSFANEAIFRTQLRAILKVSDTGRIRILFPMIYELRELDHALKILEEERLALDVKPLEIGIMVEVPAAALLAETFADHVNFFSIGTNDLTQYTLAMDRGHPQLSAQSDPLHPAVLHLIAMTVNGARIRQRPVTVCGVAAADVQAVPLLIGLGASSLSVSPAAVPAVKAAVRRHATADCIALAHKALELSSAQDVRALIAAFAKEKACV